jgi:20S proteasome alpha/beta subunit
MTIAAGFICRDGIVLATDTQYSVGGLLKTDGPKLFNVAERSDLSVVIAGAGSVPFMRMAVGEIEAALRQMPDGTATLPKAKKVIEDVLMNVFAVHVYPVPGDRPEFELLVGIWTQPDGLHLFRTYLTTVVPASDYACIGVGVYVSHFALSLMYRMDVGATEATFLAVYCIKAAKDYVDGCGKRTRIQVIRRDGKIQRVYPNEIRDTEDYCEELCEAMQFFVLGTDYENLEDSSLDVLMGEFREAIVRFREKQIKRRADREKAAEQARQKRAATTQ